MRIRTLIACLALSLVAACGSGSFPTGARRGKARHDHIASRPPGRSGRHPALYDSHRLGEVFTIHHRIPNAATSLDFELPVFAVWRARTRTDDGMALRPGRHGCRGLHTRRMHDALEDGQHVRLRSTARRAACGTTPFSPVAWAAMCGGEQRGRGDRVPAIAERPDRLSALRASFLFLRRGEKRQYALRLGVGRRLVRFPS